MDTLITCLQCKQEKPTSDFHASRVKPGKLIGTCKECVSAYFKDYYRRNLERYQNDEYRNKAKEASWKNRYGISRAQYEALAKAQGYKCAICGKEETRVNRGDRATMSVDHCHQTGKVRALLCHHCNIGLGNFQDSPDLLVKAMDYLKSHCR